MPARRYAVAAVLAVAALTTPACAADAEAEQEREEAADGEIDEVIDLVQFTDFAGVERNATTAGLVFDPAGSAIAVIHPSLEDLHLVRVTPADGEWADVPLPDTGDSRLVGVDAAPDGSVVVVTLHEDGFAVTRVDPGGEVGRVPVAEPVDINGTVFHESELSPDGTTLYLTYLDRGADVSRLLAVDVVTGAVVGAVDRDPAAHTEELEVTPTGEILLAADQQLGDDVATPVLERYDAALQPLATVPLLPGEGHADALGLALDGAGTAYVSLLSRGPSGRKTFDIVAVRPGETAATRVATQDADPDAFPHAGNEESLVVTADGRYAFQLGAPELVNAPLGEVRVTTVDLTTNHSDYVRLTRHGGDRTLALAPDGLRLLVGGLDVVDDVGGPVVWTLG